MVMMCTTQLNEVLLTVASCYSFKWVKEALFHRSLTNPNLAGCKIFFQGTSYVSLIHWNILSSKFASWLLGGFWLPLSGEI